MSGKIRLPNNQTWVWTDKAEQHAKQFKSDNPLDKRLAGTPATYGYTELGQDAPAVWVEKGYVEAREQRGAE
ncbi:hypothetical protein M7775_13595 [Sporomusa sphaeroides DSM 2875]|uniref:hypothetical protein n=1 Tax=Sporomusa sphaeroides TaxID=47679 RepID=UPI002030520D|nr:hypothetical protein [Sporomusa sphaeroides]MCM0759587.1 hypothetical protein [Sporomusa sphaeroides DSM 2875]